MLEKATFAGGCFWCTEAVFQQVKGVASVTSGYMGGHVSNPTYEQICEKNTGHAEVIQIEFDPTVVTYRDLLEVFFATHDPTTKDRQGNDVGPQYRSAVFFHSMAQELDAKAVIKELTDDRAFNSPIVTEVVKAATFWPAEGYHQRYFERVGDGNPYCTFVISPKMAKFRSKYAQMLKSA